MRIPPVPASVFAALLLINPVAAEEPATLPTYVVSVARTAQSPDELPVTVRVVGREALAAATTVDAALRDDPAFSLFRRNDSLSANPTAQGVSLRGVGPSGASRSLVLLDGLPLNDPFGGWITWSQVPGLSLDGAEVVHGGGSGVWGNAALGGTVALASAPLAPGSPGGAAVLEAGERGFARAEIAHTFAAGRDAVRLNARALHTSGFHPLPPDSRGVVDRPLDTRHLLGQLAWRHPVSETTTAQVTLRALDEDRGNGTELQKNSTRLGQVALALDGRATNGDPWSAAAWFVRQRYASFFTSVSADRMQETPANDQFAVPATAAGLAWTRTLRGGSAQTVLGLDGRWVEGETREDFLYRDGAFTQRRHAGGAQLTAGAFAHHDRPLGGGWRLSAALRGDIWSNTDGHTRETVIDTGAVLRDETHPDRDGTRLSPRLGLVGTIGPGTTVRAAAYQSFRLSTLNEFYRPFRVGNTTTRANPDLGLERLTGLDAGLVARPGRDVTLTATVYWNSVDDAVGNITVSSDAAGTIRQRQNIEETRVRGLEFSAEWAATAALDLRAAYLLADARIAAARAQPGLVGRRIPQVPRHTATFSAQWQAAGPTRFGAHLRCFSDQFEDDENQLPLAGAAVVDLRLDHRVSSGARVFVEVQNLLDATVQTGRSAAGLVTHDRPRELRGGVELTW